MKIYKKLLGIIFLLLSFNSLAQEKIYKIATDIDFPPFQYRNSRNELIGIDIELLEAIAKNQNFKYEILELGFQGAINALNNGEVDAIFSAMTITDKRKEKYDFSNPYVKNGIALAVKEYRGKRNESSYITCIAAKIAEILGIDTKKVEEITTNNAMNLFNLHVSSANCS